MPSLTQKICSSDACVPQDFRVLSRCACLGNYVLRRLGWESFARNHQKSRVDYLLDLAERPQIKPEIQVIEQYLLRKDILTFIEQQRHDFFRYRVPDVIFMDSFSELTDQLFVHRKEKRRFLANYSDIDRSGSFEQSFECRDLLELDGLESLYRTFFSKLRTVYPDTPVVFLHYPTTLDRREKFRQRATAIRQAVEHISGEFENLYSLSIADNVVREPEECIYEELKDFAYHYHQDVYKTFAQQILSLGIGHGKDNRNIGTFFKSRGGNEPTKIYCVLFDAMPLSKAVVELAGENNMELLRQVGGCFTTTSLAEMLTGKLPSDLEKNGIGYDRHQCYRSGDESDIHWLWEDELLLNRLHAGGWDIKIHNGDFYNRMLTNNPAFVRSTAYPGGVVAEREKSWADEQIATILLGRGVAAEKFYQAEIDFIEKFQSEKPDKNTFYFIKYDIYHIALMKRLQGHIAADRLIQLMKVWNFNESNSLFWLFSNHGDWNTMTEHPNPDHYLSWAMFKDNTADAIEARSKLISVGDFFATVMNKLGYDYGNIPQIRSIQDSQDPDRIYFTEDGRQRFDPFNSTTAIACKFTDWHGDKPSKLNQVSYFKLRNEYKSMTAEMDENGFIAKCVQTGEHDTQLKQALIDRFEWVDDTGASDEPRGWTFGIITNGKRDAWVNELIESIISQNIPQYEIIVCGTYADTSGYPVRYIEFNENDDKGWLTKKKNIVAANAIYENVCIFHDRIRLATGWYEGMKKFGDDWAVQYCGTFSPDGREKHNDAMVATAINGKYVGCNLDHNDWDPTMWIDGAQIIAKKALLLKCNLDEELFHCEGEDVEWCRRIQRAGFKIKFNPHSVLFNICEKKVTENFDRNTMTAIAYPSRYADVFKVCLISASDCGGCKNRTIQEILQAEENLQKLGHEKLADLRAIRQAFYAEPLYVLWNGLSLEAQGYYRQASDEYRRAINLGFDHWRIKFYLARSEFTQGNTEIAEEIKREIIRANPQDALMHKLFADLQQPCKTNSQQHAQLLRKRIRQITSAVTRNKSQAGAQWLQYENDIRQMILNGDLSNFLNWDVITATMFHEAKIEELRFLQNLPDWNRWQNAIQESPVGNPRRYSAYPESSGNVIHHAYTLAQLEQKSQCRIEQLSEIVEFGGGYGSKCRLAYKLGFKGRYIIYDLPEFTALQEYFLNCIGFGPYISHNNISNVPTGIVLLSDMNKLSEQINFKAVGRAFIACWSISETPVEIRNHVFNLVSGADYYLIAYQNQFGEVDDLNYFSHLTKNRIDIAWTKYPIAHLPENHYLIGHKKSLHITEPDNDKSYTHHSPDSTNDITFSKGRNKPTKIYCVLFDTMPLLRSVIELAQKNSMELLRQVGGCFTTTSCAEMLTGKFPSDLEKNGIGYDRHQCYRNGDESDVHWPWEKELIVNRLLEYGWKVKLHNGHYFSNILSNNPAFEKTTSLPGGLQAEKEFWNDKKAVVETILGDGPQSEQFYQDEIRHIHQIQSEKPAKDKFYFVKYDQFHVADVEKSGKDVAARRAIELMKQWDFSEPNAIFWFFSDHGDWRTMGEHPQPDHYLSWVMFRDNTADTIEVKSRFIFAGDFFPTIMNKFGYRYESTPRARSIQQPQDTDRIYCTEDGRQRFDKNDSTTAIACRFTGWEKGRPTGLEQVSYFKPRNEFVCLLAHLNADGFVTNTIRIDKIDECLKQALADRFEWVNESSILSQAGDTQWMKNIRICQDTPDIDNIGFDNCDPQTNGEYALIPYLIRPGDIVFDIGANKGTWSRNVLSTVSPVRIYSFEPVADTFAVLKDNLGDSRASLHNVAISDSDGGKTFFYYNQSSQSAELSSFYRRSFSIEQSLRIKPIPIPVRTRTLDSFCKEHLIPYIDFLKIDTEGAELDVLRGAFELLRERKIKKIQFEYGGTYPDAGITLQQVCQLLSSYGYTIFRILPDGLVHIRRWHDSLENNLYSNYLVVSPERINDYGPMEGFTDSKTEPYYKTKAETVPQTDTLSQLEEAGLCRQGQPPRLHLGSDKQGSVMFAAGKNLTDFNSSCSEKLFS